MTLEEMVKAFSKALADRDYSGRWEPDGRFGTKRADLHAFLLLESLLPGKTDIVSAAEHDQIWLDIDMEDLAAVITPEQVEELDSCGVMLDEYGDALSMFV